MIYDPNDSRKKRIRVKINKAVERFTTVQDEPTQRKAAWWLIHWQLFRNRYDGY
ncbi:MAG: hypothetical protein ACXAC5_04890 [Promethearchaeota archaeon]|jgi:hypothetical protein